MYSRTGTRYIFFYILMSVVSVIRGMNEQMFLCGVFIFWVSSKKNLDIDQKTYWIFFSSLWIINTEKASLLLMCSVKKAQHNMKNLKNVSAVSAKTLKILKRLSKVF